MVTDVGSTKRELIEGLAAARRRLAVHRRPSARRRRDRRGRERPRRAARGRALVPDPDAALERRPLRPAAAHRRRPRRPAAGDRPRHPRPGDGDGQPPARTCSPTCSSREAAAALSEESERLPEVGTSFRDTTRVAGANPAIWADIFATNRDAVADGIDSVGERLREAAALIRAGDRAAVGGWHAAAGTTAAGCSSPSSRRRPARAADRGREPARDGRRDRARARPRPGQHRGHGALPGARHAHRCDLGLGRGRRGGRAGGGGRPRPRPRGRGRRRRRRMTPLRSRAARCAARSPRRADKSISHRAALVAAMGEGETAIANYLDAADTRSTLAAVEALGARSSAGPRPRRCGVTIGGVGLRGARGRGDRRRQRRHAAAAAAGLARRPARRRVELDGDESIRRRPVDRVVEPLRLMGAEVEARDERLPPLTVRGAAAARDRVPAAGRERAGEVVRAARRPARRGPDERDRAAPDPRPHRAHAARRRGEVRTETRAPR